MLDQLTVEDFKTLIGQRLPLRFGDQEQFGEVIEARPVGQPHEGSRHPFSVILASGDADQYWPQGIHVLIHPTHGELELFMVPIGPQAGQMRYEISFS
jgi:hypothetical protein